MPDTPAPARPTESGRRLRVLTWHVHGNYLYYLTQAPHDFTVVTRPGFPPGYAGLGGALPWGDNVRAVPHDQLAGETFDCVLFQSPEPYTQRLHELSPAQRALPRIYVEHDPPQGHPTDTPHWFQDPDGILVHVTAFNQLMWDSGVTPTRVIEHGVVVPPEAVYRGDNPAGIVVVNHLKQRGRRLGSDVFEQVRRHVRLDLVGMDAQASGGLGEIANPDLPAFMGEYRYFFNPIRYTSLGLAVIEAMTVGLPIIGLATTEMATAVKNEETGYVDTRIDRLIEVMQTLAAHPDLARRWGENARRYALERFGIERFAADWDRVLREAVDGRTARQLAA